MSSLNDSNVKLKERFRLCLVLSSVSVLVLSMQWGVPDRVGANQRPAKGRLHYAPSTALLLCSLVLASWSLGLLPSPEDQCRINKRRCIRPSSLILVSFFVPVKGRPDSTTPIYYRVLPRYCVLGFQSPLLTSYPAVRLTSIHPGLDLLFRSPV